jgi:hypothetical protein
MPQASAETIKNWPHGQGAALELLETNYTETDGWFCMKSATHEMTEQEEAALLYLIEEWDYGYRRP